MNSREGISLELRTIKTFHTIVQSGSFYKAAEILNYSQPTISMRIKQLEQDVGAQLFERGKKLKLTRAGRLFHERPGSFSRNTRCLTILWPISDRPGRPYSYRHIRTDGKPDLPCRAAGFLK